MIRKTADGRVLNYIYNTEDRLVRVEESEGKLIAEYGYDPFGRRLWKEVDGIRTYFLYSDEGLIGEYTASGAEIKAYGWKPGSTWGTDPLFMKIEESYYFYHNDHLGTAQKITAVNGRVVWAAKNTSFGDADIQDDPILENHLRFAGQYLDEETGLHYNWNRYYDPAIGRYLTTDPLGIQKEEVNLFLYVKANPIRNIDNTGLLTCGSGRNEPFVPDNPFGFGFSDCCQQHDDCYGTCGAEKTQCDDNFEQCMINSCISEGQGRPLRQALCRSWARRYSWWVRNAGGSAFENAQADCNCPNENR
jgi:RHS repeat-associated protein